MLLRPALIAKSLGIKTVITPHGWTTPQLPINYYQSQNSPFDGAIAHSAEMKVEYIAAGLNGEFIFISPMVYFAKFLPVKNLQINSEQFSRALLLPPDYTELYRLAFIEEGLAEMLNACHELQVGRIAIKTRSSRQYQLIKKLNLNVQNIEIFTGYTDLHIYAKEFEIVIGPPCSATLECLMLGIPYYCFLSREGEIGFWSRSRISNILYVAKDSVELKYHIHQGLIFKEGKTIDDLINISKFRSADEISQFTLQLIQKY